MLSGQNPQQAPGIPNLQDPNQQQGQPGQVNFGQLKPITPTNRVVAQQAPDSGGGGIGDLLSGLKGLVGGISKSMGGGGCGPGGCPTPLNGPSTQGYIQNAMTGQGTPITSQGRMGQLVDNAGIFKNALSEMGVKEGNPALSAYLAKANPGLDPSKTPWCAGYVGSVLNASGIKGTGSLTAKSYLQFGTPVQQPSKGDIVVFNDLTGKNDPAHGHVGFVDHVDQRTGQVYTLGGNQDNSVSVKAFPTSMVAGYRHPPSADTVQQYAQKNNIQNPMQLSQVTKSQSQNNMNSQQTTFDSSQFYGNPSAPRGLRNNNPGNIESTNGKYGPEVQGKDPRFANYATPEQGLSAMNQLLDKHNGESLTKIIGRYAPPNENNTSNYINTLSKSTGLKPNDPVDMSNPQTKAAIMKGIIQIENGHNPYPDNMISGAISGKEAMNKPVPSNMPELPRQPTPQEDKNHEDMIRQIDAGHDDYSSIDQIINGVV